LAKDKKPPPVGGHFLGEVLIDNVFIFMGGKKGNMRPFMRCTMALKPDVWLLLKMDFAEIDDKKKEHGISLYGVVSG